MKGPIALVTVIAALSAVMASPVHLHGQQPTDPADHAAHHPGTPTTQAVPPAVPASMESMMSTAKLDELVKKMNSAEGAAKTEAMAELLTALVQERRACEPMMTSMMKMIDMMRGAHATMPMQPPAK